MLVGAMMKILYILNVSELQNVFCFLLKKINRKNTTKAKTRPYQKQISKKFARTKSTTDQPHVAASAVCHCKTNALPVIIVAHLLTAGLYECNLARSNADEWLRSSIFSRNFLHYHPCHFRLNRFN